MSTHVDHIYDDWTECWQCSGVGILASCFEDTCSCLGDPDDPLACCAPGRCDICKGKGGWNLKGDDRP